MLHKYNYTAKKCAEIGFTQLSALPGSPAPPGSHVAAHDGLEVAPDADVVLRREVPASLQTATSPGRGDQRFNKALQHVDVQIIQH